MKIVTFIISSSRGIAYYAVICALLAQTVFSVGNVKALTAGDQRSLLDKGISYYDINGGVNQCTPGLNNAQNFTSVYVLGDSITNQSRDEINKALTAAPRNLTVTKINADPGRAISVDTAGSEPSGIAAVTQDALVISQSGAIVIALGTNSGTENLSEQIPLLIKEVRKANKTAPIFWVNLFYTSGTSRDKRNSEIVAANDAAPLEEKFIIINTVNAGIELSSDNTHPTAAGEVTFAETIANGVVSNQATAVSNLSSSGFNPLDLRYPNFSNEDQIIETLKQYISERYSKSPFAKNLDYVDQIFSESRAEGVNPLLVMAVARQENGFGQAGGSSDKNNYFGMIENGNYLSFPTPTEGIAYFIRKVGRHVKNPSGPYANMTNFYEYLSVHQIGMIAYPGEYPPEARGRDKVPPYLTYDSLMNVYTSWDPTINAHKNPDNPPQYNPGIYFRNSVQFINAITGLTVSDTPTRGSGASFQNPQCNDTLQLRGPSAGVNGWDLPGEGANPMAYYYSQVAQSGIRHHGYTDYYGPSFAYGITTIQKAGCGPASVAMVVSNLTGVKVGADTMGEWFVDNGYQQSTGGSFSGKFANHAIGSNFETKFGVTSRRLVQAQGRKLNAEEATVIAAEIKKGNFVVVSLDDGPLVSINSDTGEQGAHITTIRAVTDDGKFLFADTSDSNSKNNYFKDVIPLGSSRTPLAYDQIGTINTGVYVFERTR